MIAVRATKKLVDDNLNKYTTMKKTTKKKTVKPDFLVDCVNVETVNDVYTNTTVAKVRAGKPITEEELDGYAKNAVRCTLDDVIPAMMVAMGTACCEFCGAKKKQPWYKRLWNWIRRK